MDIDSKQCQATNSDSPTMDMKRESERETVEPEKETVADKQEKQSPVEEDITLNEMLGVDEQYVPLLTLLEQFSPGEDGIQSDRTLRDFKTTLSSLCPDEEYMQQEFVSFRETALQYVVTARKLAAVGASFTRHQRQRLLRRALLNVVAKLDMLERSNPLFFIHAANLMGDYFADTLQL